MLKALSAHNIALAKMLGEFTGRWRALSSEILIARMQHIGVTLKTAPLPGKLASG